MSLNAASQTPFEGKIIYTATGSEKPDSGYLTIYFGKPGIRLELVEARRPDKVLEPIIINLDSGKVFELKHESKTYKQTILKKREPKPDLTAKKIAGFDTRPKVFDFSPFGPLMSFLQEHVLHVSDELNYPVPEIYDGNFELIMVQKGKIVLGAEFYTVEEIAWPVNDTMAAKRKNIFSVFAKEVIRQPVDPALFAIPPDYSQTEPHDYRMDSISVMLDTTVPYLADTTYMADDLYTPKQKTLQKKKKTPPKKKPVTSKQKPVGRKED